MNYIINPSWFYWINVVNSIRNIFELFSVIFAVMAFIFFALFLVSAIDGGTFSMSCFVSKKTVKVALTIFAFVILTYCLLPSDDTLIEMMIAKQATYDNAQWTLATLKSAVDYIVNAIKSVK